jgi:transposase
MPILIIIFAVLIYQWNKKEKAIRAAEQWEKDNNAVEVAKWLDQEMCKEDPDWRQRIRD